ncbi:ATP-dependent Clp protease proteolytic subunit, partial [Reichenbachiella sp.]|uniref:ATP-dependent Clp protease proteolytic subunit n=1 Tax=Reichenbachiella sp. TaxID=2184521 RepID=UPI003298463D
LRKNSSISCQVCPLFHIMGQNSGHTWQEIEEFFRRDRFLNALEAKEYGFVDEVLGDTSNLIKMVNKDANVSFYKDKKKK